MGQKDLQVQELRDLNCKTEEFAGNQKKTIDNKNDQIKDLN